MKEFLDFIVFLLFRRFQVTFQRASSPDGILILEFAIYFSTFTQQPNRDVCVSPAAFSSMSHSSSDSLSVCSYISLSNTETKHKKLVLTKYIVAVEGFN